MRVALRFGYDGRRFHGYARQPNVHTVEGEMLHALERIKARHIRFRSASRTDRGVSAISNVVAFDTNFRPEELPRALNAGMDHVFVHGWAEVDMEFDPRKARQRWYRYHLFGEHDIELMREVASLFIGKHDFSSFARVEDGKNPIRRIDSMEIHGENGLYVVDIRAQSFLWQMVRRLVGAMFSVEMRERSIDDVRRALEGEKLIFRVAEPEPLFLMSVDYGRVAFNSASCRKLDALHRDVMISGLLISYISGGNKETL